MTPRFENWTIGVREDEDGSGVANPLSNQSRRTMTTPDTAAQALSDRQIFKLFNEYYDALSFARAVIAADRPLRATATQNAIADSIERVISTDSGRELAAMIREGVTELDSHVSYAFRVSEIERLRAAAQAHCEAKAPSFASTLTEIDRKLIRKVARFDATLPVVGDEADARDTAMLDWLEDHGTHIHNGLNVNFPFALSWIDDKGFLKTTSGKSLRAVINISMIATKEPT